MIKTLTLEELKEIYNKYICEDFPMSERRPFRAMAKMYNDKKYTAYGYYKDDKLLAYSCFYLQNDYALLDYFAVMKELRNQGIGSAFLQELTTAVKDVRGIIIEAEDPKACDEKEIEEKQIRERRIAFYKRNSAIDTDLRCRLFRVEYVLLLLTQNEVNDKTRDDLTNFYKEMYKQVYGKLCKIHM